METKESYQVRAAQAHLGDPCRFCGTPHDEVEIGPCPGSGEDILSEIRREEAEGARKLAEYDTLDEWLRNTFGNLDTGGTLQERVENVVRHYATQLGRWAGG